MDVAQALANTLSWQPTPGTFSLPGPSTLSYEYLLSLVSSVTYNPPSSAPVVPQRIALALARAAQSVWWPLLSPDEVLRRYIDDADVPGDWARFGVAPDEIEEHAITYLRRYRSAYVSCRPDRPRGAPPAGGLAAANGGARFAFVEQGLLINTRPRSQGELHAAGGFPCLSGNTLGESSR